MSKSRELGELGQIITVDASANTLTVNGAVSLSTNTFTVGTGTYFVSNGNIGVGTNTPDYGLVVKDSSDATRLQVINAANNTSGIYLLTTNTAGGVTSDCTIRAAGNNMTFFTAGGNERMRIAANGNVGIGNSSPNTQLTIQSSTAGSANSILTLYGSNSSDRYTGIDFRGVTSETWNRIAQITAQVTGGGNGTGNPISGDLIFRTNNANASDTVNEAMRVCSNGNIGIGNTAPTTKLTVYPGNTQYPINISCLPSGHASSRRASVQLDNWLIGQDTGGSGDKDFGIYDYAGVSWRFVISNTGNVGIGTATSPAYKLDVNGTLRVTSGNFSYFNTLRLLGSDSYQIYESNTVSQLRVSTSSNSIIFSPGLSDKMMVAANGNVGVGTTSPAYKLDVSGSIKYTGDILKTNGISVITAFAANTSGIDTNAVLTLTNNPSYGASSVSYAAGDARVLAFTIDSNTSIMMRASATAILKFTAAQFNFNNPLLVTASTITLNAPSGQSSFYLQQAGVTNGRIYAGGGSNTDIVIEANRYATVGANAAVYLSTSGTTGGTYTTRTIVEPATTRPGADNAYTLGASGSRWSVVWAATATISTSDINTKKDIIPSPLGLDFINQLKPVAYKFKVGKNEVETNPEDPENPIIKPIPGTRQHFGLIAQEVKSVLPEGIDFGGWIQTDPENPDSEQGLRYEEFIAPIIKAIQELKEEFEEYKRTHP